MESLYKHDLPILGEEDLVRVTGGGELALDVKVAPPKGMIDLSYQGRFGAVTGSFGRSGKDWTAGLGAGIKVGKASLEGNVSATSKGWEAQARIRIPLG